MKTKFMRIRIYLQLILVVMKQSILDRYLIKVNIVVQIAIEPVYFVRNSARWLIMPCLSSILSTVCCALFAVN